MEGNVTQGWRKGLDPLLVTNILNGLETQIISKQAQESGEVIKNDYLQNKQKLSKTSIY